jgi:heme-degrading monooxygenase HmoA
MSSSGIAQLPAPPYYAVIFTSKRTDGDHGYAAMSEAMIERGRQQPGFLGLESARGADGVGVTVSYWRDLESIRAWKDDRAHGQAQRKGQSSWYEHYEVRIARVERAYASPPPA